MRKYILLSFISAALMTGCQKKGTNVSPNSIGQSDLPTSSRNTIVSGVATQDVKVAPVPYQTPVQKITVSQNNNQLQLSYLQKITLLVDAATYNSKWGITFKQDFSPSVLAGFTYTTTNNIGEVTTDWATVNLNEVNKSTKDTAVNGADMIKIYFERKFNFIKNYNTAAEAASQIPLIQQRQQDMITVATFYQPQSDASKQNTFNLSLTYNSDNQ